MKNGFFKVAAASPDLRVADCKYNVKQLISIAQIAESKGVRLIVFPELSITAYTCGDLFRSTALLASAEEALADFLKAMNGKDIISVVGLPVRYSGRIYNCAAICNGDTLEAIVPKGALTPDEARVFTSAFGDDIEFTNFCGNFVSFDTDINFTSNEFRDLSLKVCIGDNALPSLNNGANVIAIPAASPETACSAESRRTALRAASSDRASAIIYACPGYGESTTDSVFAAHNIICENGSILAESTPFMIDSDSEDDERLVITDIDVELLVNEAARVGESLTDSSRSFNLEIKLKETNLTRNYPSSPFIPCDEAERAARFETILNIQSAGLRKRMEAAYVKKLIIGISGGLDSTLALLVAARACDRAKRPRTDIIGVTMPCFGTTERTKGNAELLCEELGIQFRTVHIGDSVKAHFRDIGHDESDHNVVFENAQARERTQVLMDIANAENGIVIGTGDMSELALGWATYNGDHMSMYGVNASIPKTLVRALTGYCALTAEKNGQNRLAAVLNDIIDTPVSPELLPADGNKIKQKTEDLVGPYEIHDFYLYYMLRYGFSPAKLFRIANRAFEGVYDSETLLKWLGVFVKRFISQQYKRSCLPDGPATGSVSLSPRGGLHMPSDASSAVWMAEVEKLKNE